MAYQTQDYYTNDLTPFQEAEILKLLHQGYAVRVGSSCLGHTRSRMVELQGQRLFNKLGARRVVEEPHGLGGYYAIK